MIGDNENEASAAAAYIVRRDNSAEMQAQAEYEEFVRQNQEIHAQLASEFAEAPFAEALELVAERLGSGMVESWKYAFKGSLMGVTGDVYPQCPRSIRLGASIERLSWSSENYDLLVRAVSGMILRYRQLQGELLPQSGATERCFARYGMPYQHRDNELYRERGLFVVAYQPHELDEPAMISFGELDEARWKNEGTKLVATEGLNDDDSVRRAGLATEQGIFIRNLFDVQIERQNHLIRRDQVFVRKGLFRLNERAFVPGHHLNDMDEFSDAVKRFVRSYHNPLFTDEEFREKAEQELDAARERVKMGDVSTFLAYHALARALKKPPEIIINPEVCDPCANTSGGIFWEDSLPDMRDYPLYQQLNQESLDRKRNSRSTDKIRLSYQEFHGGASDVNERFLEIAGQYLAQHGSLKGLLY
jgi:hypothetical protein